MLVSNLGAAPVSPSMDGCRRKRWEGANDLAPHVFFSPFFVFFLVLGLQEGRKQGRKQQPGSIGKKEGRREGRKEVRREGRKEGRREGRKEGRKGSYFCAHLRWKHWQQRYFLLNPEPKPYGPKALNHPTP